MAESEKYHHSRLPVLANEYQQMVGKEQEKGEREEKEEEEE